MKVSSRSFHDLYSAKLVCKKFNQLGQHDRIFEEINIWTFDRVNPLTSWTTDEQVSKQQFRTRNLAFQDGDLQWSLSINVCLRCTHDLPHGDEKEKDLELLHSLNHQKLGHSHSDPIGINGTMTNSVPTICATSNRK
ncbi:hypothetical protein DVH24_000017 [Malus domestica]|uniref:F-box domain-containing protein n=1 Tax=Malus domestica TaxID=3750 RepID=A0A498IYL7_MALDO|nr:hypothetical protein DVH24_000017 [Malus domestica]